MCMACQWMSHGMESHSSHAAEVESTAADRLILRAKKTMGVKRRTQLWPFTSSRSSLQPHLWNVYKPSDNIL